MQSDIGKYAPEYGPCYDELLGLRREVPEQFVPSALNRVIPGIGVRIDARRCRRGMGILAIVPEANEWVQTVTDIDGRGGKAKQWIGQQLRPSEHVGLEVGTLSLVVHSMGAGKTRREWVKLMIVDPEGVWLQIDGTSKTYLGGLTETVRKLLRLEREGQLYAAYRVQYQRAHVREYRLEKWVSRIEKAICTFPSRFQAAPDSRDPTLQLPTALPQERFTFYVEPGGEERGLAILRNALSRAASEFESARSTMQRYEATRPT